MKIIAPPLALGLLAMTASSHAATNILQEGDFIIAIQTRGSRAPAGEPPASAVDNIPTTGKYLNFGGSGSGFIIQPANANTVVQSFTWSSANDTPGRNPSTYEIYGTNSTIVSANGSRGLGESWNLITSGALADMPINTTSGVISFANGDAYNAYKVVFPTLQGGTSNLFQIGEFSLYESPDGTGSTIYTPGSDTILAIGTQAVSSYPAAEGPANVLVEGGKYLNFARRGTNPGIGGGGTGVIVTPDVGPTIVGSMILTAGNDTVGGGRTPTSYAIYGTNDAITSPEHSFGDLENWTLISEGSLVGILAHANNAESSLIEFANSEAYSSYKIVFPTIVGADGSLFELGRIQLFQIPEPGVALLSGMALLGLGIRRRR